MATAASTSVRNAPFWSHFDTKRSTSQYRLGTDTGQIEICFLKTFSAGAPANLDFNLLTNYAFDAQVRKRSCFSTFYAKTDRFTKTGSGQTQGTLKKHPLTRSSRCRISAHLRLIGCRGAATAPITTTSHLMPRSSLGISVRSEARKRAKETRERGRPLFSVFGMLIFPLCVSKVSIEQDY